MKITSQKREGNKITLEIETEYSAFTKAVDQTLLEAGKEINIPGFRPGKAPKDMVKKAVNPDYLEAQAAQKLISELYPRIIDESKIEPVDFPNVEIVQQKKKKPFIFKIVVDVYPEVKLGKYKGLKVEKKSTKVTEADIEKVLGNLQDRFAKPGPDGKKETLPLGDEFAKKVSRFGTLAELKNEVKTAMLKDRQSQAESDVKNTLIAAASAEAKVDVPSGMIEREIDMMIDELRANLAQTGLTFEDYLKGIKKEVKDMRDEIRQPAEMRIKGKVVLRAVAEAEKVKVSPEEMEEEFKKLAASTGEDLEDLKKRVKADGVKFIEDYMLRQKALDLILDKAKIKSLD